jgi:hypothetical protein
MLLQSLLAFTVVVCLVGSAAAQTSSPSPAKPAVHKVGPNLFRIGSLQIDTAKREITAPATINDVTVLEFVANTRGGFKAYESVMTVDSDATTFNAALLLIGLDPARAKVPRHHFDPEPPQGDPIELFVDWTQDGAPKRSRVEDLIFDSRAKTSLPAGPWVYTGSTFLVNGDKPLFLAESDGVLIGFVHSPSPLIENAGPGAVNAYGALILNPGLELKPGTQMTLTVRALPRK